ncbi:MAG: hypothetical protein NTW10_00450 [Bacteroidetes bacterium]|nr:hypothetical protein [Bacteroidota bacterium]
MKDIIKSIRAILDERISSPFYGTLIVSWLLWNWKIPYVTFFVDAAKLSSNKIDYIINNCSEIHHLVTFPLISTLIILTLLPFVTNGAYWITLYFDTWRIKKKNDIEKNQLLTLEQSVQLRMEVQSIQEKFDKLVTSKDEEIELLKKQIDLTMKNQNTSEITDFVNLDEEYEDFVNHPNVIKHLDMIAYNAQNEYPMPTTIPENILNYYVVNDIIKNIGRGTFKLTTKGKKFLKQYLNDQK